MTQQELTIGELFPADDRVAHWVYGVTALAEDLLALSDPMRAARAQRDVRGNLVFYRLYVTRLYEAGRLVTAATEIEEVREFVGDMLSRPGRVDLREMYLRAPGAKKSPVEELYAQLRHRTVHYMRVGSTELRDELARLAGFPAQVSLEDDGTGSRRVQFRWVQVVSGMEVFGDVERPDFFARLDARSKLVASIGTAWLMAAPVALIVHARRLGIDTERLGQVPEPPHPGD